MEFSGQVNLSRSCDASSTDQKQTSETAEVKPIGCPSSTLLLASTPFNHFQHPITRYLGSHEELRTAHARKLKALKDMLLAKEGEDDQFEALEMVDAIQRLGIDYHFCEEIGAILKRQYMTFASRISYDDLQLHETATRFRLLRQQGFYVPPGVFDKFKDKDGSIKCNSNGDIKGLMALYEASQLSFKGEDVLEEARDHSHQLLNSFMTQLDIGQAKLIKDTLEHPHHKSLAKFMARNFQKNLRGEHGWENDLISLAKLEFKMVQSQHQQEIVEITKWWKDLGLCKELKFARDQPLKWYVWTMACLTDPMLSEERIELTKPVSFIYIIDDIFDVYGRLDDLILFTQVVNRWDMAAAVHLPDYMKLCFKALDNVTKEISNKIFKKQRWNPLVSLQKAWASLCNAFLVEAKWFASGQLPKAEDYLKNGIISSGVHVALVHIFFLSGQGITKETVELLDNNLEMISSPATILRLWDDLGNAEDEDQQGHDGSYIKCYMNEHKECSLEAARQHVADLISEAWKQLNQECLCPNPFSSTFTKAALNVARTVPLMYNYDCDHRLPSLEEHVNSILFETASL